MNTLSPPKTEDPIELLRARLNARSAARRVGFVNEIVINTLKACLPDVMQGELCEITTSHGRKILGEVIAFDESVATISCLESPQGIPLGAQVTPLGRSHSIQVKSNTLSMVLDGMGRNLDQPDDVFGGVISVGENANPVLRAAPAATQRPPIERSFTTRVKAIDCLNTMGVGQRLGIFAPPGCGKSTLLSQIVRGADVDVVVFGLVGERGRELREFIEREISEATRRKCVFVCATSDKPPIERVRAAFTATSIAESFRDQGLSVLLLIDSLTRLARAQREIGLSAGEPTTQSGLTPSVYTVMPELIERAGRTEKGDITAIYTVLLEAEQIEDDPIASEAKSLLDGHIILSKKLVEVGHFPAIDPLRSLSRVMSNVADQAVQESATSLRIAYTLFDEVELLIRLNEYKSGNDALIDEAVLIKRSLDSWCQQDRFSPVEPSEATLALQRLLRDFQNLRQNQDR